MEFTNRVKGVYESLYCLYFNSIPAAAPLAPAVPISEWMEP